MKFFVDEMPNFYDECPFSEEKWSEEEGWRGFCILNYERCNLNEGRYAHGCYGLKVMKGADDEMR